MLYRENITGIIVVTKVLNELKGTLLCAQFLDSLVCYQCRETYNKE